MSHDLYTYNAVKSVYFKLSLAGVGQADLTLEAADIKVMIDGGAFVNAGTVGTIAQTTGKLGWYKWTPNASVTDALSIIINVKDDSAGGAFDENAVNMTTGGHTSAFFAG